MNRKLRIFILDDEEEALYFLKKGLIARGFEAETALDSREAFERIKRFNPDLILLDLRMPHLGGFEVCEMLNGDSQIRGTPILVISALSDLADIKRAYQLGVEGYLTKPFSWEKLLAEMNRIIAYKFSQAV